MNICVFHGSNRKGNTDIIINIAKDKVRKLNNDKNIDFIDFYLPRDLPDFCLGCFSCLSLGKRGGELCPHKKYTFPIADAIEKSDGIIVGCPVYALAESAQIKNLFDHFACTYMNHRLRKSNFKKCVLILTSCAGVGNKQTIKTIKNNFIFWGIPKIYSVGIKLWYANWSEMPDKRQAKCKKSIEKYAGKFAKSIGNIKEGYAPLRTRILFFIFRHLVQTYPEDQKDKIYYKENGWFGKKRPWK